MTRGSLPKELKTFEPDLSLLVVREIMASLNHVTFEVRSSTYFALELFPFVAFIGVR